ncbi:MAG: hypothetical protein LJE64_02785 [Desulfofustis sp.]|nr:hypothetical protein [Desulfofustis sp.]
MDALQLKKRFSRLLRAGSTGRREPAEEPTVYLHIGMPKTATTAIQRFLFQNRSILLEKQQCLYPDHALHWQQHVPLVKAIVRPVFPEAIFNKAIADITVEEWMAGLKMRSDAAHCRKIIISSEFFWAAPAMQTHLRFHGDSEENFDLIEQVIVDLRAAFSSYPDVRVVVYLRRQDTWLESFFNQQIKIGAEIPPEDAVFEVKNYLLYAKNLSIWRKHFGSERVLVRFYEQAGPDIIGDFCGTVEIDASGLDLSGPDEAESVNPSLSARAVAIMRRAREEHLDENTRERLRIVLTRTSLTTMAGRKERCSVFSRQFHDRVLLEYEDDTRALAGMYPEAERYLEPRVIPAEQPASGEARDLSWEEQLELLLEALLCRDRQADRP